MNTSGDIRLGVAGIGGRGGHLARVARMTGLTAIHAICDLDEGKLRESARELDVPETYTSYDTMISRAQLNAVIIGTPMPYHVPQAIAALRRGLHVLSEVPAAVSVEECRDLVAACKDSPATYAMAENVIHTESNVLIASLVQKGLFGEIYYAEGEYLHELKQLNDDTHWRRIWQTGIDGITYGTHCLGPILEWFRNDRIESLCCIGSGHHYLDSSGKTYENQDTCLLLGKLESGGLIKVRVDMLSERPHAMSNFALQGTEGAFESARAPGQVDRIWLKADSPGRIEWRDLSELREHLPASWVAHEETARTSGHSGSDYYTVRDFLTAVHSGSPPHVDIHRAMDLTLPGLISQQSIARNGVWLNVPNSRDW